jgi:Arc/MetJ-type ribon-helix-helix transcriptional regulator
MRISLTSEIELYIRQQLDAGRYKSADELVQLALEYFRSKQDLDSAEFDPGELNRLIAVGQAEADRDELLDGDEALRLRRDRRSTGQSKRTG